MGAPFRHCWLSTSSQCDADSLNYNITELDSNPSIYVHRDSGSDTLDFDNDISFQSLQVEAISDT